MSSNEEKILTRDVEAAIVPVGTKVTLKKGETAYITQSLGGSHTVVVNGNMFRIDGKDADALGFAAPAKAAAVAGGPVTQEALEKEVWEALKTCYDPEIPVNIVDLGLVYELRVERLPVGGSWVEVKMTLTAPGCGMGSIIAEDARERLLALPGVAEAGVEIVWDPPWHPSRITPEGRRILGLESE